MILNNNFHGFEKHFESLEYEIEATIANEFIESMPTSLTNVSVSLASVDREIDDEFEVLASSTQVVYFNHQLDQLMF